MHRSLKHDPRVFEAVEHQLESFAAVRVVPLGLEEERKDLSGAVEEGAVGELTDYQMPLTGLLEFPHLLQCFLVTLLGQDDPRAESQGVLDDGQFEPSDRGAQKFLHFVQ